MTDRNMRKTRVGKVVSNKMQKTVVVVIQDSIRHKIYNKIVRSSVRLKVHDENSECSVGDQVRIMETRPVSKQKRWRVFKIIEKAK
ncbi:MAG: 30S ribosomal protein S17 [Oscillospiraceae bacterium]|nr:30S ribosomal protein S17 [Oscillospiraceae bacterium]